MTMHGKADVACDYDTIISKPFRILGTTDDIFYDKHSVILRSKELASQSGKRIYIVKVIGYTDPAQPPAEFYDLEHP